MKNLARQLLGHLVACGLRRRSRPFVLAGSPSLVLAPHADDETLGCGGLLALRSARGAPSEVVFISDSAGSPEANPPAGLSARRRAEALAALQVLGVGVTRVHFLDAPDGRLDRLPPAEAGRVHAALVALLQQIQPADVFMPYLGGGSSEHDGVARLVRTAVAAGKGPCQVWEYPVWAWWDARRLLPQLRRPEQNHCLALGAARAGKLAALACHASQVQPDPATGAIPLPPVLAALCTGPAEFYFNRQP